MINGSFNLMIFWAAAIIGATLYICKIPSITLGIGLYLPFGITFAVFIGGMIRFVVDKFWKKQSENGTVVASRNIWRRELCRSSNSDNIFNAGLKRMKNFVLRCQISLESSSTYLCTPPDFLIYFPNTTCFLFIYSKEL